MVKQDLFRQDLYYRINVVRIDLPPLRARGDDIGLLAEFFANRHSREMQKPTLSITPEAYQVLRPIPLAGQCPRVAKRDSSRHCPVARRRDRSRRFAG